MKVLLNLWVAGGLCAAGPALAQAPALEAGLWALEVTLRGAPVADPAPSKVCLNAEALGQGPERALLDAALRGLPGQGNKGPQCSLDGLIREGANSRWQARCSGPRGPMAGTGSAVLATHSATLQQAFELDTPWGSKTLQQIIRAKRTGAC